MLSNHFLATRISIHPEICNKKDKLDLMHSTLYIIMRIRLFCFGIRKVQKIRRTETKNRLILWSAYPFRFFDLSVDSGKLVVLCL